jgi:hypothetical protein
MKRDFGRFSPERRVHVVLDRAGRRLVSGRTDCRQVRSGDTPQHIIRSAVVPFLFFDHEQWMQLPKLWGGPPASGEADLEGLDGSAP